jgi:arylformamidase
MIEHQTDWDDAYANAPYIPDAASYPPKWAELAATFRTHLPTGLSARLDVPYGPAPRNRLDLFLPQASPKGLVIFIHGGYWLRFGKDDWSHLAQGALHNGYACALPGYTHAPQASISHITAEIAQAIALAASQVSGPIHLAGHSAGGHLATRQVCTNTNLTPGVTSRIRNVVSISGLHDLRPLLNTSMNTTWGMSETEAVAESPALHAPLPHVRVTAWVGAAERPEFLRQSRLLIQHWQGRCNATTLQEVDKMHHFSVVEHLAHSETSLVQTLIAAD